MSAQVILIEASPRRVSDGAVQTVRLAGGGALQPYTYGGNDWLAGIQALPATIAALEYAGGEFGSGSVPQAMELVWAPATKAGLAAVAAHFWKDAAVTVRLGEETIAPAPALPAVLLTGKVIEAEIDGGRLKLSLSDPAAAIKKPLLSARYAGTGGAEGPAEWAGQIKPRVWGRVFNLAGQPIDKANNIYCFADPARQLNAITAVRDKGAPADVLNTLAWQGSVAATFTALQAAAAPAGGGVVCPSIACVKWWTQPAGALCADLKGENGAAYVETTAEIAARLIEALGGPAFAAGTVAAAAASRPAPVGWLAKDENTTVAAMLDELCGNSSLAWMLNASGEIVLRPYAWGASAASAKSHAVTRRKTLAPLAVRKLGYQRNETQQARGELAAIVLAAFGNRVRFSQFEKGLAGWTRLYNPSSLAAPGYSSGVTAAHYYAAMSFSFTATGQVISFGQDTSAQFLTPVTEGEWLAVSIGVGFSGPVATVGSRATVWFRNAAGTAISSTDLTNTGTAMGGIATQHRGLVQVPANATSASIEVYATSNAAGAASITLTRPSIQGVAGTASDYPAFAPGPGHEFGADVTAAAQVTVELATDKTIPADYLGAVSSTDLGNALWAPVVQRGAAAIKVANGTSYALANASGGTFAVDNTNGSATKGNVTISAMTANVATVELTVTVDGVAQPKLILRLTKQLAAPPPPSGGGSGATISWSAGEFAGIDTTSFTAVVSPVKTIALASGQSLYGTAPLDYYVSGMGAISRTMTFKWQYAVAGSGSWNDFATGITGGWATSAFYDGETYEYTEPYPGTVAVTQTKSGLSAGDYDIRLVAQCNATGRTCSPSGVATMEAKV